MLEILTMIDPKDLPKFILTQNVHTRLDPVDGAYYCVICDPWTNQSWRFGEDTWTCCRFDATKPIITEDYKKDIKE